MPVGTPILQILQRVQDIKEAAEKAEQSALNRAEDAGLIKEAACNVLIQLIGEYQLQFVETELPAAESAANEFSTKLVESIADLNQIKDDLDWLKQAMPAVENA